MAEIEPKRDMVFKRIFGTKGNEKILKDFLEYVLEIKINSLKLDLSTELLPDFSDGKSSRVDVRAELGDGTQVDIEIQTDKSKYSEKRCLYYWSKMYSSSIEKSEKYETLRKTICLWIVDGTVYNEFKEYESTWKMEETKLGIKGHFDEVEMHVIELKKFRESDILKPSKKEFWLWFIDYTNREMVDMACLSNERIKEAREQLDKITKDRDLMLAIVNQEMFEMDQRVALDNAIKEGEKNKQLEIAKNMKSMNIDIDVISKATGLTKEEIEKL